MTLEVMAFGDDKKVAFKPFDSRFGSHHCDADKVKRIFGRLDANTVAVAVSEPLNELVSLNTNEKMATFRMAARAALEYCGSESTPVLLYRLWRISAKNHGLLTPDQLEFIKAKKPSISETTENSGRDWVSNTVEMEEDGEEEEEKTPTPSNTARRSSAVGPSVASSSTGVSYTTAIIIERTQDFTTQQREEAAQD